MPKIITILVFWGVLLLAKTVFGDDLGLFVARVSSNEGAFFHRTETALVWQVVRVNGGSLPAKQYAFLSRHSKRVAGLKPCLGGNCLWSPFLNRAGIQPPGLILPADLWEIRIRPLWFDVLAYADWMVGGQRSSEDPCHIPPRTWGGAMDREEAIAVRGLYPIGCAMRCKNRDSCDDGFAPYNECWADGHWICDPLFAPAVESVEPLPENMFCSK